MDSNRLFHTAIVLTNDEVHARRDRDSLKVFKPSKILHFTKGSEAFDFLSHKSAGMVLCDSQLDDMEGFRFIKLLRQNMNLKSLPVVMVTMDNRKDSVLAAIASGCTGYVLRPYSMDTFERHIKLAHNLESVAEIDQIQLEEAKNLVSMGDFDDAIEAFEEIIEVQDEARKYYDMGCQYLFKSKFGKAIIAFKKAVKINDLFAEAYKGLADAYKGKGDLERYKEFLKKAAEVHAQFDRLEETKILFMEVLKYEAQAPNPFNTLGVKLRQQGDYLGALHAYQQALEITPDDEHIHYNMSKAYFFMGNKDQALERVKGALGVAPDFQEAAMMYKKLSGKEWVAAGPGKARERSETMVDR